MIVRDSEAQAFRALPPVRRLLFSRLPLRGISMRNAAALAILAFALAGCGKGAGNGQNAAGGTGLPVPGPRPEASARSDTSFRQRYREINISSCVASAEASQARGTGAPAGADIRGYCACFIDGAIAGVPDDRLTSMQAGPREQSIADQCARERGLGTDFTRGGGQ